MKKTSYTMPMLAKAWGISRQRVQQLFTGDRLPPPDRWAGTQPLWDSIPLKPAEIVRGPKAHKE